MQIKPLFTIAVLSYNNYFYIKETLDSIFSQDYQNIQLIISNDGSKDFNQKDLENYIKENSKENIKDIQIYNHEQNMGTVKNVKFARLRADGEYFMLIAADDALYDQYVFSHFVEEFERLGKDAMILSARVAMCSTSLSEIVSYEPSEEGINAIKIFTSEEMFSRLTHTFTIPTTSTCYRMELYKVTEDYDDEYFIIEDAPFYIRLARMGIKFYWIDNMVAARHRDGGVSHGNHKGTNEVYRKYRHDELKMFEKEIWPYKDKILKEDLKKAKEKFRTLENIYFYDFIQPEHNLGEYKQYLKQHKFVLLNYIKVLICNLFPMFYQGIRDITLLILAYSLIFQNNNIVMNIQNKKLLSFLIIVTIMSFVIRIGILGINVFDKIKRRTKRN